MILTNTDTNICSLPFSFFLILKFIYLWLCLAFDATHVLFSSCGGQGLLFVEMHVFLTAVASLVSSLEHELQCARASTTAVHSLSLPAPYGIFPDQGLNLRTLHWDVDF